jgi:Domain of unknown function (DUF4268)
LTYAAGRDAVTIVWIARRFTEQHRATLDWLNRITGDEFNFFGLEIELWRIGDSAIAPKFNVVCQPNGWRQTVKEGGQTTTPIGELNFEFWGELRDLLEQRKSPIRLKTPAPRHSRRFSIGRKGFLLLAVNSMDKNFSRVYLRLHGPNHKANFGVLEKEHKAEIEQALGGKVYWRELPNNLQSQIVVQRASTPADKSTWPELKVWFAETLETMAATFKPLLSTLDVSGYFPTSDGATNAELAEEDDENGLDSD